MAEPDAAEVVETPDAVDVYWRPGCGFCSMLLRSLNRSGMPLRLHNIWEDPEAAAIVRGFARGHETVPTVVIGGEGLVNPSKREVAALVRRVAPHLLPD